MHGCFPFPSPNLSVVFGRELERGFYCLARCRSLLSVGRCGSSFCSTMSIGLPLNLDLVPPRVHGPEHVMQYGNCLPNFAVAVFTLR